MRDALAKLLVCPDCRTALALEARESSNGDIQTGLLHCRRCSLSFAIERGIPRFVHGAGYASTFDFEWQRWRRTQFDTDARRSSQTSFIASTGRNPSELAARLVLDAGCGSGRYMDLVARAGAEVIGVDLSQSVEVAQENLGSYPNCHFVQADLGELPFAERTFDFIYSLGVLHHTPDTRRSFNRLVPLLKPGGEIAIWVYPRTRLTDAFQFFPDRVNETLAHDASFEIPARHQSLVCSLAPILDWLMRVSGDVERVFTVRLPAPWLYRFCYVAIPLYHLYRIPLFYPLRLVTRIAMDPDPEWRVLNTFDWYSPRYQRKHRYEEVREWFERAGLVDISLEPRPVAVRGRKAGG